MRDEAAERVRAAAIPLGPAAFSGRVAELIGDADIIVIGGATYGSHELYRLRADLTRTLIESHGFTMVAIDADWDETFRLNRFVRLAGEELSAGDALGGFTSFPRWMWRNHDVAQFVEWLRQHNATMPAHGRVGLYGLDVFGMYRAIEALFLYLRRREPKAVEPARRRYAAFDVFGEPPAGAATPPVTLSHAAEHDALAQLVDLRRRAMTRQHADTARLGVEDGLAIEQDTRALAAGESYYRELLGASAAAWNTREHHLLLTLETLVGHALRMSGAARLVLWTHNTHAGDASGTQFAARGLESFGQRVRSRFGARVCTIGFTTHGGGLTAATQWNSGTDQMPLRPSLRDSYERLFHESGLPFFAIDLRSEAAAFLRQPRLERAIGAVYHPDSERWSHYFEACLPRQFDIVIHCDETLAVEPLEPWSHRDFDLPETLPTGV